MSKSKTFRLVGVLLLSLGYSGSLHAAIDTFLDLGSSIPGESQDQTHLDQVDVLAWSWGMSNSGTTHMGGGGGAGKASFQDIRLTKYVDKSSPLLMSHCANGVHIPAATLYVRKAGKVSIEYVKIQFANVLVTSVSTGGSGGEDRLTENISLNFAKVELDYVPIKSNGTANSPISIQWDIANNTGTLLIPNFGLAASLIYTNGSPTGSFSWSGNAGVKYQIWATSDLNVAFQIYGTPITAAADGAASVTVPADAIRMFFRVERISTP
jgi:type VI secretion system secreted protein Hcp